MQKSLPGVMGGPWGLIQFLVLVVLSILMLAVDRANPAHSPFLSWKRAVAERVAPAMGLISAAFRTLNSGEDILVSNWHASSRVRALERDKRNLQHWRDLALALHEKMLRYEVLLHAPRTPQPVVITARVVSDQGGPFVRARLINAGARDGVARGQAALSYNGLVGRVMNVGQHSARVLMLTDFNSRVPVMIAETGAHAILAGDNSAVPRLVYVARGAQLKAGDRVVTSGEDGVLPRGMAVGALVQTQAGLWRVRLFARSDDIDFVTILKVPPVAPVPGDLGPVPPPLRPVLEPGQHDPGQPSAPAGRGNSDAVAADGGAP